MSPFAFLHKKYSQLFTLYLFSFYASHDELEHWKKKKTISQAKIKIGTLSRFIYKSEGFCQKTDSNCSRNVTFTIQW